VLGALGAKYSPSNKNAADFYCAEVAACQQSVPLFKAGVKAVGGNTVYTASVSSTASNYIAQCLAAKSKNVGFVWVSGGPPLISGVATSCASNGYKPVIVAPNYDASFLKAPAMTGAQFAFDVAPYNSSAAATFQAAVSKYDPGLRSAAGYGVYSFQAWLSGQAVAKAIELAKPTGAPTAADVYAGLYKFNKETLGGGTPPLTFVKGKLPAVPCAYSGTIKGGQLVQEPGMVCAKG